MCQMKLLFHFQDTWWQQVTERLATTYQVTQHENPDDCNVNFFFFKFEFITAVIYKTVAFIDVLLCPSVVFANCMDLHPRP
jgi:hypothetical protein